MKLPLDRLAGNAVWRQAWWAPFASTGAVVVLFLVSHATLLVGSTKARWLRRALMFATLYLIFDLSLNFSYTFGSDLRDTIFGPLVWNMLLKALDIGLVYDLEGEAPPRWCVPDWNRCDPKKGSGNGAVHTYARTSGRRPLWARSLGNYVPRYWMLLDLPTCLVDRCVWTLDVTFMRRPGTSWLFPDEMRALEWSKVRLEHAGTGQSRASQDDVQPFGYSIVNWKFAVLDTVMFLWAMAYLSFSHVPGSSYRHFFDLPFWTRIRITAAVGMVIALPSTLGEKVLLPLFQRWPLRLPATALIPTFQDVGRSRSLTDLWSRRWHAMSKRDFVRTARLLPFGRSPVSMTLKVFFLSGMMHSLFFTHFKVRHLMESKDSSVGLRDMLDLYFASGPMLFFMLQGILVILEQILARAFRGSRLQESRLLGTLQNIWVWSVLLYSGQWLSAELTRWNLLHRDQILSMRKSAVHRDFGQYIQRHASGM